MSKHQASGPPYMPRTAILGDVPNKSVDVPITSIFLVLFTVGAASNMIIFRRNKSKGHKFLPSFLLYVFCMARIMSCIMRLAWACHPDNAHLAIAATIFVSAGVLILFLVNLIFAQRVLRARQPQIGWHPRLSKMFKILYALIGIMLTMSVIAIIQSYYTLNLRTGRIDHSLQLGAMTYFLSLAFFPLIIVYVSLVLPRKVKLERFGLGRWRTKLMALIIAATLCTLGAAFRTGTTFMAPRPKQDPAWYHARWCFYIFDFTIEASIVCLYLVLRVDQRFYIPNGSSGPGDYSRRKVYASVGVEKEESRRNSFSSYARIISAGSSVYSASISEESEESELSDLSPRLSLALPETVKRSKIDLRPLAEAPYIDIQFTPQDDFFDWWPSWPAAAALRPFGL